MEDAQDFLKQIEQSVKTITQKVKIHSAMAEQVADMYNPIEMNNCTIKEAEYSIVLNKNGSVVVTPTKFNIEESRSLYNRIKKLK